MAIITKVESPLLSQLDLAKSQYAENVEDALDCLIALYLKIKSRFMRTRRRCKTQDAMKKSRRNPGRGANNGNRNSTTSGKFRKPSADEKNRRNSDGNIIFYHKNTER
jgi:hypothetical protein